MNEEDSEIKALTPSMCPKCHADLVVESRSFAPRLAKIYLPVQLKDAKDTLLRDVEMLPIPLEKKKSTLEWLRDENLIITPDDVPNIIRSIVDDGQTKNYDINQEPTA